MATTDHVIVRYTGSSGFTWEKYDLDVSAQTEVDRLEPCAPDFAEFLVETYRPDIFEYYDGNQTPDDVLTSIDGLDIEPSSVKTGDVNDIRFAKPADGGAGIQAAHDTLPSDGGDIVLQPGTYTVDARIDIATPNVTVRGPSNAIIKAGDNLNGRVFDTSTAVDGLTFEGFELDGNKANQDTTLASTNYYGFGGLDGSNHTFRDLYIHDTAYNAIVFNSGDNHTVENCRFEATGAADGQVTAAHVAFSGGTGHTLRNNYFAGATDNAFYTRQTTGVTVSENTFDHCFVNAVDADNTGLSITNNDIIGTPNEGQAFIKFAVAGNSDVTISGNRVHGQDGAQSDYRAFVWNDSVAVENATITNNTIVGNGAITNGVEWTGPGTNLTISGNTIKQTAGNGIKLQQAYNVEVTNNLIHNCNTAGGSFIWGVRANTGGADTMENLTITGNQVIDDRATVLHYEGISVAEPGADWVTVSGNTVRGATNALRNVPTTISHLVYNGVGYNAGDPATTGQWNGEGYEGLTVRDTTNSVTYTYLNGAWV